MDNYANCIISFLLIIISLQCIYIYYYLIFVLNAHNYIIKDNYYQDYNYNSNNNYSNSNYTYNYNVSYVKI